MTSKEKEYFDSVWEFTNEEEREKMTETITPENCGDKLILVRQVSGLSRRELAKILGCSESTIVRIERKGTLPTNDFLFRLLAIAADGWICSTVTVAVGTVVLLYIIGIVKNLQRSSI